MIGINTAIYSRSGGYMGIGFAIPINMALKIKDQLIQYGEVRRGKIGAYIQELTPQVAESLGLKNNQGVLISDVVPNSPADQGGIQAGDVVIELDGEKMISPASFRNRVSLTLPNSIVKLSVIRAGEKKTIKVKIGSLDGKMVTSKKQPTSKQVSRADKYGLEIEDLSKSKRRELNIRKNMGVLIVDVEANSVADRAGLRAGQVILSVNQKTITNVREFKKIAKQTTGALLLQVKSEQGVRFIVLSKS